MRKRYESSDSINPSVYPVGLIVVSLYTSSFYRARGRSTDHPGSQYQEIFAICQALPGPASTKLGFCIALSRGGFSAAIFTDYYIVVKFPVMWYQSSFKSTHHLQLVLGLYLSMYSFTELQTLFS
jgi:hypothetical protein